MPKLKAETWPSVGRELHQLDIGVSGVRLRQDIDKQCRIDAATTGGAIGQRWEIANGNRIYGDGKDGDRAIKARIKTDDDRAHARTAGLAVAGWTDLLLQDSDDIEPDAARLSQMNVADADQLAALGGEANRMPVGNGLFGQSGDLVDAFSRQAVRAACDAYVTTGTLLSRRLVGIHFLRNSSRISLALPVPVC